jgi:hypothetical protein
MPHHTEYEMPGDGVLWANGFESAGPYTHPHSFARVPNGNLLAAVQRRLGADGVTTGVLVELDTAGRVLRAVTAATAVTRPFARIVW